MKNSKFISILMLVVSGFFLIQCTSDLEIPDPIAGPPGVDGVDGVDGADGSAASCIACHSNDYREPIIDAYLTANHAIGSSWARGTNASCAECHNNEGFIDFIEVGAVDPDGYPVSNPITCTGCHDTHRSFDFENDGNDYAVRTLDAVPLRDLVDFGIDYTIDYGNASNTCANCHQPRRGAPSEDPIYTGRYIQTSSHWGPHHGPQTALLEGLLGAYTTFTLVEAIPPVQAATHRTGSSCIECHMGGTTDGSAGHTWVPSGTNCATCHPNTAFEDLKVIDDIVADFEALGALLENVVGQAVEQDMNGDYQPVFEADGVTPVPVVGIVHRDGDEWEPQVGLFDLKDAEAAWNFLFIYEDKSGGVHNPAYARSLLKNSLEAMQN